MAEDAELTFAEVAAAEQELQFSAFTNDDAWELGCALVEDARASRAPVAIEIRRFPQRLFFAALPGAVPDNAEWIERKVRVVSRFLRSSLYLRLEALEAGTTVEERYGLDPALYAAHGGAFPVIVRDVGVVGAVTVSGLPQFADHRMVVNAIRRHLQRTG